MEFLVGRHMSVGPLHELAFEHLEHSYLRSERLWRPWETTFQTVHEVSSLQRFCKHGAIVSFMHHGQWDALFPSLGRHGIPLSVIIDVAAVERDARRSLKQVAKNMSSAGAKLIPTEGAFDVAKEALRRRNIVGVAADAIGSTETPFLGQSYRVRSGGVRLATLTGVPIVPVVAAPFRTFQELRVLEPIFPEAFGSAATMQQAVMQSHEAAILSWPQAVDERQLRGMMWAVRGATGHSNTDT